MVKSAAPAPSNGLPAPGMPRPSPEDGYLRTLSERAAHCCSRHRLLLTGWTVTHIR
jgi:hypothetical protein